MNNLIIIKMFSNYLKPRISAIIPIIAQKLPEMYPEVLLPSGSLLEVYKRSAATIKSAKPPIVKNMSIMMPPQ